MGVIIIKHPPLNPLPSREGRCLAALLLGKSFVLRALFRYNYQMRKKARHASCEVPLKPGGKTDNRNRQYAFQGDFTWKGVKAGRYKDDGEDWSGIVRQVLIGGRGETAKFHLRYFEIKPGGCSSYETHRHEHVVVGIRGRGRARLNRRNIDINYLDVLYINPDTPHRLDNPYIEPFGFFCIVNAERDRPRSVKT